MRSLLRPTLIYLAVLLIAALGAGTAAFVVAHEPRRDALDVVVGARLPAADERILSGTVVEVDDGGVRLRGPDGDLDVRLTGAVPVDELRRLEDGEIEGLAGARVNLGAAVAESGLVLTGVVAVEEAGGP